jgi:hypothetical protein
MKKAEAYKILHIAPPADARSVEEAYWQLAHSYREELKNEVHARQRLIELNEAYSALMTHNHTAPQPLQLVEETPQLEETPQIEEAPQPDFWSTAWEAFVAWARSDIASTAARWPERGAEIAVITICLVMLTTLAALSGADLILVLPVLAIALITIRAPWRRPR